VTLIACAAAESNQPCACPGGHKMHVCHSLGTIIVRRWTIDDYPRSRLLVR